MVTNYFTTSFSAVVIGICDCSSSARIPSIFPDSPRRRLHLFAQSVQPIRERVVIPRLDLALAFEPQLLFPLFLHLAEVGVEKIPLVARWISLDL